MRRESRTAATAEICSHVVQSVSTSNVTEAGITSGVVTSHYFIEGVCAVDTFTHEGRCLEKSLREDVLFLIENSDFINQQI